MVLLNEGMIFFSRRGAEDAESNSLRTRIFDFYTSIQQCRDNEPRRRKKCWLSATILL